MEKFHLRKILQTDGPNVSEFETQNNVKLNYSLSEFFLILLTEIKKMFHFALTNILYAKSAFLAFKNLNLRAKNLM